MSDISDDALLRLKDAVKIAFPASGMSVSGLRQEHLKGRLKLEKIAGKHFVTLRAIREMRERCEDVQPTRRSPPRGTTNSPMPPTASSQDVATAAIRRLREGSSSPTVSARDVLLAKITQRKKLLRGKR